MQDDILCPVMTPREAFMFAAKLRLKLPNLKIKSKVSTLLKNFSKK